MQYRRTAFAAALLLGGLAAPASAQLHITPTVGSYLPGDDPLHLREGREDQRLIRGRTLSLGLNLEAGVFRGTVAYATQAEILNEGIETQGPIGEGRLLAITGGVALRPIPRFAGIQPYAIGGLGVKRAGYSWNDDGFSNALPDDKTNFALQAGAGVDLMLGGLGFTAEIYDMITPGSDNNRHDTFIMAGLRLRLGNAPDSDNNN
ncbi:MAG: hypothetical protein ACREL7_11695 [Longimicrobiales bacterium]